MVKPACNQSNKSLRHWASEIPAQGSGAWSCTTISGQLFFREQREAPKFSSLPRKLPWGKKKKKSTDLYQGWALHLAGRGVSCCFHLNEMLIPILSFCREMPGPAGVGGCGSRVEVGSGTLLRHIGHPGATVKKEDVNFPLNFDELQGRRERAHWIVTAILVCSLVKTKQE